MDLGFEIPKTILEIRTRKATGFKSLRLKYWQKKVPKRSKIEKMNISLLLSA